MLFMEIKMKKQKMDYRLYSILRFLFETVIKVPEHRKELKKKCPISGIWNFFMDEKRNDGFEVIEQAL
ncbi:hypothetical protein SAMN05443667_11283 [Flavobacterium gillisiae]|uniref:Uncharacterized protein n=2 Tax=Flavobacterium gillisiae TaxID=150146 RepID=A0A1H4F8J6_9FLAO|nr:hypothetical protein SAMN05443667_11283 [Flavobacterium gillisiae]